MTASIRYVTINVLTDVDCYLPLMKGYNEEK